MRKSLVLLGTFLLVAGMVVPAVWADFLIIKPRVSSSGTGNASATARFGSLGPWEIPEPGIMDDLTVTPEDGAAIAFGEATAEGLDGTATGTAEVDSFTSTQEQEDGNIITAFITGKVTATSMATRAMADPDLTNLSYARLIAAGGPGTVTNSDILNTQTGFMLAHADAGTEVTGSEAAATDTDATSSATGDASVTIDAPGNAQDSVVSISDAVVNATGDVDGKTDGNNDLPLMENRSWVQGLVGYTVSDAVGLTFGAIGGINSEVRAQRVTAATDGEPTGTTNATGAVAIDYTAGPFGGHLFSLEGNASGRTDATAELTDGLGTIDSQGQINTIGFAGTGAGAAPNALAWLAGNVGFLSQGQGNLAGTATGNATINATEEDEGFVPNPSMTVNSHLGEVSAAVGSSTTGPASVTADVEVTPNGAAGMDAGDVILASSFGFAQAGVDARNFAILTEPFNTTLYDIDEETAFVGFGSLVAADEAPAGVDVIATAENSNLYGAATSPNFFADADNAASSASVTIDALGVYQRESSVSITNLDGTNLANIMAHNQLGGAFEYNSEEAPWWTLFDNTLNAGPDPNFDHFAVGFVGGGGD